MTDSAKGPSIYFKSSRFDDPATRIPTKLFVSKVLSLLLEEKKITSVDRTHFIVGCPSAWDKSIRERYRDL
jgi:hypothetical protein